MMREIWTASCRSFPWYKNVYYTEHSMLMKCARDVLLLQNMLRCPLCSCCCRRRRRRHHHHLHIFPTLFLSHSLARQTAKKNCAKNIITKRNRDRIWERKLIRGKKLRKSKSLIKTVLFVAELSITWLLLLFSFSVFLAWALIFVFHPFIHSLTHILSHCFAISFVTWLTTYVHSSHAIRLNELFGTLLCCCCDRIPILFARVFAAISLSPSFSLSFSCTQTNIHACPCLHSTAPFMTKSTNSIYCEKLKIFTNKQQIKIWQKCFQIIICSVKESEASDETSIGKE